MLIPAWVFLVVGALVILFGGWRIRLGFRSDAEDAWAKKRGGIYAVGRRTHLLVGTIYILMGVYLILGAFGIKLFPSFGGASK